MITVYSEKYKLTFNCGYKECIMLKTTFELCFAKQVDIWQAKKKEGQAIYHSGITAMINGNACSLCLYRGILICIIPLGMNIF